MGKFYKTCFVFVTRDGSLSSLRQCITSLENTVELNLNHKIQCELVKKYLEQTSNSQTNVLFSVQVCAHEIFFTFEEKTLGSDILKLISSRPMCMRMCYDV